jgi:hypothetical protein
LRLGQRLELRVWVARCDGAMSAFTTFTTFNLPALGVVAIPNTRAANSILAVSSQYLVIDVEIVAC